MSGKSSATSSTAAASKYIPKNPYAAQPYQVDDKDKQKISNNLCEIAKMDGWHDHHSISGLFPTLGELIIGHLPTTHPVCFGGNPNGYPAINEDAYLYLKLAKDLNSPNHLWCKPGGSYLIDIINKATPDTIDPSEKRKIRKDVVDKIPLDKRIINLTDDNISEIYTPVIAGRYQVSHVLFTSDKEDEDDDAVGDDSESSDTTTITGQSFIQNCFTERGINENIYIVRDVAYGNWADDICKWKSNTNEKTSQIITAQMGAGIYDPGPSVSCVTGSGKRQGFSTPGSGSRFAMFDPNNPIETLIELPAYTDFHGNTSPENLIYTRFNCLLHSTIRPTNKISILDNNERYPASDLKDYFKNANATLHMMEKKEDGQVLLYSVDKDSSNKATDLSKLPLLDAVVKLTAKTGIEIPVTGQFNPQEITHIIQKSGVKKIASKKFGDHNLGITTLHPTLHFHKFEPDPDNNGNFVTTLEESNGIHGFLSYDRVAVEAALEYGAPFVIYNTHDGAIVFFSNELIESHSVYAVKEFKKTKMLEGLIRKTELAKKTFDDNKNKDIILDKKEKVDGIIEKIKIILEKINLNGADNDIDYQIGLSIFYLFYPILKTYNEAIILFENYSRFETSTYDTDVDIQHAKHIITYNNKFLINVAKTLGIEPENFYERYVEINKTYGKSSKDNKDPLLEWLKDGTPYIVMFDHQNTMEIKSDLISKINNYLENFRRIKKCNEIFDLIIKQNDELLTVISRLTDMDISSVKIKQIIKDKTIENIIYSITPFKHTKNSSCIRTFLKMIGVGQKLPDFGWPIVEKIVKSLDGDIKRRFIEFLFNTSVNVISNCDMKMINLLQTSFDNMGNTLRSIDLLYDNLVGEIEKKKPTSKGLKGGKYCRQTYKRNKKSKSRHCKKHKGFQRNTKRNSNIRKTKKMCGGGHTYEEDKIKHDNYAKTIGAAWIYWLLQDIKISLSASASASTEPPNIIFNEVFYDGNFDTNVANAASIASTNIEEIIQMINGDTDLSEISKRILDPYNIPVGLYDKLKIQFNKDMDNDYEDSNVTHYIISYIFGSNNEMYSHFLKIYVQIGYAINNSESFNILRVKNSLNDVGECLRTAGLNENYIIDMNTFYFPLLSSGILDKRVQLLMSIDNHSIDDINEKINEIDEMDGTTLNNPLVTKKSVTTPVKPSVKSVSTPLPSVKNGKNANTKGNRNLFTDYEDEENNPPQNA